MNHKLGIIATSLLVCTVAGPVRAELSDAADASSAESGGAQNAIFSLLDKYAGDGRTMASAPISEASLISALTKAGSPMDAYYSAM
ncbi:MAG TPA: hypothetical protein VF799_02315, partial [Geobacteraceae bacterium]